MDPNQYQSPYQKQYPGPNPPNGDHPGQGPAIASLVLGIVGLFVAGIICGIIGLCMAAKAKNEGYVGGIRTAGFVLSLVALVLGAVVTFACYVPYLAYF